MGATYDGNGFDDWCVALAVSSDGTKVFVAGPSDLEKNAEDYATIAYDAVTGGARSSGRVATAARATTIHRQWR